MARGTISNDNGSASRTLSGDQLSLSASRDPRHRAQLPCASFQSTQESLHTFYNLAKLGHWHQHHLALGLDAERIGRLVFALLRVVAVGKSVRVDSRLSETRKWVSQRSKEGKEEARRRAELSR